MTLGFACVAVMKMAKYAKASLSSSYTGEIVAGTSVVAEAASRRFCCFVCLWLADAKGLPCCPPEAMGRACLEHIQQQDEAPFNFHCLPAGCLLF